MEQSEVKKIIDIKRKKELILGYFLLMGVVCSSIVLVIMSRVLKRGADRDTVIILTVMLLFLIIVTLVFGYRYNLKYFVDAESKGVLKKSTNDYWLLISSLIMLTLTILGFVLIFFKKMVLGGAVIIVMSAVVFIFFLRKRRK